MEATKCPLIDEWISKNVSIYIITQFKKILKKNLTFVITWIDLEGIILSEISQRKTNATGCHVWNLKNETKQEQTYRTGEYPGGCQND